MPDAPAFTFAVINFLLFTLFAAHHSLFARTGIKRWIASRVPPELERSTYVWIASLLLILVWIAWRPLPGVAYVHYGRSGHRALADRARGLLADVPLGLVSWIR